MGLGSEWSVFFNCHLDPVVDDLPCLVFANFAVHTDDDPAYEEVVESLAVIISQCLSSGASDRPTIQDILDRLAACAASCAALAESDEQARLAAAAAAAAATVVQPRSTVPAIVASAMDSPTDGLQPTPGVEFTGNEEFPRLTDLATLQIAGDEGRPSPPPPTALTAGRLQHVVPRSSHRRSTGIVIGRHSTHTILRASPSVLGAVDKKDDDEVRWQCGFRKRFVMS